MTKTLRTIALLSLLLFAKCGRESQTEQPYEDPSDCRCRIVNGKRVCNSACP